jgi:hypothetical protein
MIRKFSNNPVQNPGGWQGGNWEGRGYNIYSFFPEFPGGVGVNPQGNGDFEVDYQDTSADWVRITDLVKPVAIITFSRGSNGSNWEVEYRTKNRASWVNDYTAPFQPTPSPPDPSVPAETIRFSTLPMQNIVNGVNNAGPGYLGVHRYQLAHAGGRIPVGVHRVPRHVVPVDARLFGRSVLDGGRGAHPRRHQHAPRRGNHSGGHLHPRAHHVRGHAGARAGHARPRGIRRPLSEQAQTSRVIGHRGKRSFNGGRCGSDGVAPTWYQYATLAMSSVSG